MASASFDVMDTSNQDLVSDSSLSDPPSSEKEISNPEEFPSPSFNPDNPKNEFHVFPNLPPELRIVVWKLASFQPRIVHVRMVASKDRSKHYHESAFISNNSVPAVLHTTKESRIEARRWYRLNISGFYTHMRPTIYFNIAADTMYFEMLDWETDSDDTVVQPGPMIHLLFEYRAYVRGSERSSESKNGSEGSAGNLAVNEKDDEQDDERGVGGPNRGKDVERGGKEDKKEDHGETAEETREEAEATSKEDKKISFQEAEWNPADHGNQNAEIEYLAINLKAALEDNIFEGIQVSNDLRRLPRFENLKELTLYHQTDNSMQEERGEIVCSELDEELGIEVGWERRSNAELQSILEEVVKEKYVSSSDTEDTGWNWLWERDDDYQPPQIKIMKVTRLPKAK